MVKYAWSGLGSAFGPIVILSLYDKNITKRGAIAGILSGTIISALWPITNTTIPSIIPGFFISLASIYLASSKK